MEFDKELLNLIKKYIIIGKDIDMSFLNKALEILKEKYRLEKYILNNEIYLAKNSNFLMNYNLYSKTININYEAVFKKLPSIFDDLENYESKLCLYCSVLSNLIHEVLHGSHYKKCILNKNDYETKLLKISYYNNHIKPILQFKKLLEKNSKILTNLLCLKSEKNYSIYKLYYDCSLQERLANIDTFEIIKNIAILADSETLFHYAKYMQLKYMLDAYYYADNPTEFYLSKFKEKLPKIKEEINLDTKLRLGLLVSNEEFNLKLKKLNDLRHNLKKMNISV